MVRKTQQGAGTDDADDDKAGSSAQFADTVKESASQIWLAGLGAFAKAQAEGGKVFDSLVREGLSMQRRTQSSAEEKLAEATARMAGMATDLSSRASGQWDKLETIFEDRVSRALRRLDVPSAKDVDALVARIEALEHEVNRLHEARVRARPAGGAASSVGSRRPAAKKRSTAGKTAA